MMTNGQHKETTQRELKGNKNSHQDFYTVIVFIKNRHIKYKLYHKKPKVLGSREEYKIHDIE